MATFFENLRNSRANFNQNQEPFSKTDPIRQKRWSEANWSGLEKDIDRGEIRGTTQNTNREFETLKKMDQLYWMLSNEFQDRFYDKHYDQKKKDWNDVSNKQILKESTDFVDEIIRDRGLNNEEFANGKTFVENFRKYGYNPILLPEIKKDENYIKGVDKFFFRTEPHWSTPMRNATSNNDIGPKPI